MNYENDNLRELLEKKNSRSVLASAERLRESRPEEAGPALKAKKNASLDDFIGMVAEIVRKSFRDIQVDFIPDEGAVIDDPSKTLEKPVILYRVMSRVPKFERKARYNEELAEKLDAVSGRTRYGHNWSQRMDCIVQFDVVAGDYRTANKVINQFEDVIFTYTGFFKKNGVAELLFEKYYTDKNLDTYRQWLSVRSIQYFVEIEKLVTVFDTSIEDINI